MILAIFACVSFAGEVITGGSELINFKGYGTFRWTMYGQENNPIGSSMSTYTFINWLPKLNEYVDGYISATLTTPGDAAVAVDCAYLNLHFTENFTLTGGQFKVPFGYGYTRSGGTMFFADRSAIVTQGQFGIYGGRDISTMLTAEFAPVTVDLALSNGNGENANADTLHNKQFTARLTVDPTEWLSIGGSVAMIGQPELGDSLAVIESWSSNAMDFFAVANYPVSPTGTLCFEGEYMMLGYPANEAEGWELHKGAGMSVMAGYDVTLDGDVILGLMPAIRFDSVDPISSWIVEGVEPEDNYSRIDFCLNADLFSELNTLQIGIRSNGVENADVDGYTDMYANWRMNF
jgi:hypothetical protein